MCDIKHDHDTAPPAQGGIEAKAKPNLNAWVNQLIEQAIGPRSADWNEHFDRPSSGRKFRYSSQVKRAER